MMIKTRCSRSKALKAIEVSFRKAFRGNWPRPAPEIFVTGTIQSFCSVRALWDGYIKVMIASKHPIVQ